MACAVRCPLVERRGVFRAVRYVLSVHCLSPPVGDASEASRGERGGVSRIHPRTEPPQSGVPAPLGACLFAFKKRGEDPPFFPLSPLRPLRPFCALFALRPQGFAGESVGQNTNIGGSKHEYRWVKTRMRIRLLTHQFPENRCLSTLFKLFFFLL